MRKLRRSIRGAGKWARNPRVIQREFGLSHPPCGAAQCLATSNAIATRCEAAASDEVAKNQQVVTSHDVAENGRPSSSLDDVPLSRRRIWPRSRLGRSPLGPADRIVTPNATKIHAGRTEHPRIPRPGYPCSGERPAEQISCRPCMAPRTALLYGGVLEPHAQCAFQELCPVSSRLCAVMHARLRVSTCGVAWPRCHAA